jgi:hypothetical protein
MTPMKQQNLLTPAIDRQMLTQIQRKDAGLNTQDIQLSKYESGAPRA